MKVYFVIDLSMCFKLNVKVRYANVDEAIWVDIGFIGVVFEQGNEAGMDHVTGDERCGRDGACSLAWVGEEGRGDVS